MFLAAYLQILHNPNENGIVVFILGILFVLSIYHFLLYFQNKDKVYLYYSLYTFLIFLNHLNEASSSFISVLIKPNIEALNFLNQPLMWLYNIIYFIFGFTFVGLKAYSKKWYSFVSKIIFLLLLIVFIVTILSLVTHNMNYIDTINVLIVPVFVVFGLLFYYLLFKVKMPLKYYIIVGSLILFISSLTAFYLHATKMVLPESNVHYSIFYIGVIIENIIFTLGLGRKQKLLLQEKNETQEKLIKQLIENEKLRHTIQEQLEEDVALISKQAEREKFEKLKIEYEKELVELKMSSLRSQMNPHFIFNSLNAIKLYIIDSDKENAVYYLNKFSKLIRKILAATREKEITLADEIDTIKLYIEIENIRFSNQIESTIDVDENLNINTIKMPSLILQPFVENAIWHGLSPKKGEKKIIIKFEKENESHLKIIILDNGIGRRKSSEIKKKKIHKKESIGLKLIEERLINFCKKNEYNHSLNFIDLYDGDNNGIGTKAILRIPLK